MRGSFLALGAIAVVFAQQPKTAVEPCSEPRPAGFGELDEVVWSAPWVHAAGPPHKPLPSMHFDGHTLSGSNTVKLDDGRSGTLKVDARPCAPPEPCAAQDCGCFAHDSFWISVLDPTGRVVASRHLWAAYGFFDTVAVDLIDGPGDELFVIRSPGRGAPPIGRDLKILSVSSERQILLSDGAEPVWLAQNIGSTPVACARWRSRLEVDLTESKPRVLTLITNVGAAPCCRVFDEEQRSLPIVRARRVLRFDQTSGLYTMRGAENRP